MTLGIIDTTNSVMASDVVSDLAFEALIQEVVVLPNVRQVPVLEVATQKLRRKGALTGEAIAEGAGYTFGANGELTDTGINLTASKLMCASQQTFESMRLNTGMTPQRIVQEQGAALGRAMDAPLRQLATGLSQIVTATTILTINDLLQALFLVQSGVFGKGSSTYKVMLDYKGVSEIRREIVASPNSIWTNPLMVGILGGLNLSNNGFQGTLLSMLDVHVTAGLPTATGDRVGMLYNPEFCLAAAVDQMFNPDPTWIHGSGLQQMSSLTLFGAVEVYDAAGVQVRSDQ